MYDENLIPQIKAETDNTVKLQLVEKMYISNLHLIRAIASEQSISQDDFYDYLQLGYSAMVDAVNVYSASSNFSFLSYFRRIFKHKIYLFNLEFRYPFRIKSRESLSNYSNLFTSYGTNLQDDLLPGDHYNDVDLNCYCTEIRIMSETIISILKDELDSVQFSVIVETFWYSMTKNEIAIKHSTSYSRVRCIYFAALRKLRKNKSLYYIASDMFGIKCAVH